MVQETINRVRAEYLEMPELRLTLAQIQRFCGVDATICEAVVAGLVDAGFLRVTPDERYARVITEGSTRHRPAKAHLARDGRSDRAERHAKAG